MRTTQSRSWASPATSALTGTRLPIAARTCRSRKKVSRDAPIHDSSWPRNTGGSGAAPRGHSRGGAPRPVLSPRARPPRAQALHQGARPLDQPLLRQSGTTVRAGDSSNGCYIIGGASGEPSELKVYAYVQATSIPASARLSYTFTTPWDRDNLDPGASLFSGPFSHGLFKAYHKQQAELFNGPTGKQDYFTYRMLPSGTPTSQYINGKYLLSVSVKVGGRTLSSRGGVTVAC